jgi:hypothetical protein
VVALGGGALVAAEAAEVDLSENRMSKLYQFGKNFRRPEILPP